MLRKSYLFALVFLVAIAMNYSAIAQPTVSFESITEAFAFTGDKPAVIKVIITGEIEGNPFDDNSEWYKFRSLNETFPNIEEVEILTNQSLPYVFHYGLFGGEWDNPVTWLKRFSAPNVKWIGDHAFGYCTNLASVNFPSAVVIEGGAFEACSTLTEVTFPAVTEVKGTAFSRCENLTSANFPLLTTVSFSAFRDCSKLKYVSMPSLLNIGMYMFSDCKSLTNVDFPQATAIELEAFKGCSSLVSVNIPLATSIGDGAFAGCINLTSVDFPFATTVGDIHEHIGVFLDCASLISANIPLATRIGGRAFSGCSSLTSADFPLITEIKYETFQYCSSLAYVNIPLATSIGDNAFASCSNLPALDFPLATFIGKSAFYDCNSLTSIDFPWATEINDWAFGSCKNLTAASFGTGFTTDTRIEFDMYVFSDIGKDPEHTWAYRYVTENIDLTLGDYVLPKPDMQEMRWQCTFGTDCKNGPIEEGDPHNYNYIWKSINGQLPGKTTDISETTNIQLTISPNPTSSSATLSFDLKEASNLNITLVDINSNEIMQLHNNFEQSGLFTKIFSIANLPVGIYFVKIALNEKNVKMEKIVKY